MEALPTEDRITGLGRGFLTRFGVYLLLVAVVIYPQIVRAFPNALGLLRNLTASVEHTLLQVLTPTTTLAENLVSYEGFSVEVVTECTGLFEIMIFTAAVLAFSTSLQNRLVGIVAGALALYATNVARIGLLLLVGHHSPQLFDWVHAYLWQGMMLITIILIFAAWVVWIWRGEASANHLSAP